MDDEGLEEVVDLVYEAIADNIVLVIEHILEATEGDIEATVAVFRRCLDAYCEDLESTDVSDIVRGDLDEEW